MIEKSQTLKTTWLDVVLWFAIAGIVVVGSYLMYFYREQISVFRLLFTFCGFAAVVFLASKTTSGIATLQFSKSAWIEMSKVVWPKADEARHISTVVVCAVAFITMLLWLVDSILTVVVRYMLG